MAGMSSRFFKAGFTEPKYKLLAHGKSLFQWSVNSFEKYFDSEKFVFICRDVYGTPDFISSELNKMGVKNFEIITLDDETRGQAETVFLSMGLVPDGEEILIFNIDTYREKCTFPENGFDAWLEVFSGDGDHWSFAKIDAKTDLVVETAEKNRISDFCSNGVYYFKNKEIFLPAYNDLLAKVNGELYIAPMYNYIIQAGGRVGYKLVDLNKHIFMGTPAEYNDFLSRENV